MALTTVEKVRDLSELSEDDISDADLAILIDEISPLFWKDISVRVEWEEPDGKIDDLNNEFRVLNYPIAPTQLSITVVPTDIQVFGVKENKTTGFEETTSLSVLDIYFFDGRFQLTDIPLKDEVDEIRVNYSYIQRWVDWDKVATAVAYLVASKAFDKISASGEMDTVKFKDVSITEKSGGTDGKTQSQQMMANYQSTLRSIKSTNWMANKSRSETRSAIKLREARRRPCF